MFVVRRTPGDDLDRLLKSQSSQALTYAEVGATRGRLPDGYRHDEHAIALGKGDGVFERAAAGLRQWQAHRGAGLTVHPGDAELAVGTTVLVMLRLAVVVAIAACRVVYVVDEPDAFGFAYGTLPAHPEQGEESFVVRRDTAGAVRFEVTAFSRPRHPLARLGGPVSRQVQLVTTRRYLQALQAFVDQG